MIAIHNEEIAWFKTKNLFFHDLRYQIIFHLSMLKSTTTKHVIIQLKHVLLKRQLPYSGMWLLLAWSEAKNIYNGFKAQILLLSWSVTTNIYNGFKAQTLLLAQSLATNIYNGFKTQILLWHDLWQRTYIMDLSTNLVVGMIGVNEHL